MKSRTIIFIKFIVSIIFFFDVSRFFPTSLNHIQKPSKKLVHERPVLKSKDTDTALLVTKADSIVAFAMKYLGAKYCYGGEDTKGFD